MSTIHVRDVMRYALLPGIVPRLKALFGRSFGYVAYLMANVYGSVRLLPPEHPYLRPQNIGKFNVIQVIAAAANRLHFSRKNIDQIAVFFVLLSVLALLVLQFVLLVYSLIFGTAEAGLPNLFDTPMPQNDVAFLLLDNVFGVPNLFCNAAGTCTTVQATLPFPFHVALHKMFQFYSTGLLILGFLVFLYYIVVLVLETATTGSPFGQRFQSGWAPIRLVVAIGLLVPIHYGLNSGQYVVLYAAKMGSGLATNGWRRFNTVLSSHIGGGAANPAGERNSLIAKPMPPDVAPLVQFLSLVHACRYAYWRLDTRENLPVNYPGDIPAGNRIQPYFVKNASPASNTNLATFQAVTSGTTYAQALNFYDNGDIIIRFGERDPLQFLKDTGNVKPYCGELRIRITDLSKLGTGQSTDAVQRFYFDQAIVMYFNNTGPQQQLKQLSYRFVELKIENENRNNGNPPWQCAPQLQNARLPPTPERCKSEPIPGEAKQFLINFYQSLFNGMVLTAWNTYNTAGLDIAMTAQIMNRGWGGAGIWYNVIARLNGAFSSAIMAVPQSASYPLVMEQTRAAKRREDKDAAAIDVFNPNLANNVPIKLDDSRSNSKEIASMLSDFYKYWNEDGGNQAQQDKAVTGDAFRDTINFLFGTKGLFAMRGENAHIHPLAQLTSLGKGMVDAALTGMTFSAAGATIGGLGAVLAPFLGTMVQLGADIMSTTAILALTAGLVLYYVLPFLPFLYFYFAVGTWIMSIFEAMVGVPLWALAHLRLDGEGLPGDSASNGYYFILEIFLRPILSVVGLIAALTIFTAQARVLNFIWDLVVNNLSGHEEVVGSGGPGFGVATNTGTKYAPRDFIDEFFYTAFYAFLVYMLATASFKLIDKIPDHILRWMGSSGSTFSDINPDPTEGITRYVGTGGYIAAQQIAPAINKAGGTLGQTIGKIVKP